MPRKSGSQNLNNYHYKVDLYDDNDKTNLIESNYFRSQNEIKEKYGLNRSAIYFIVNPDTSRIKKYKEYNIEKLTPPIPIFRYDRIVNIPQEISIEVLEGNNCL